MWRLRDLSACFAVYSSVREPQVAASAPWWMPMPETMAFMTIFSWLLIGHFVGDWMFQNDWMARDKRGRWWSSQCVIHCIVYTTIMLVFAWFGSGQTATITQLGLLFSVTIFTHWLIDGFNLAQIWGRVVNQTQSDFVRIVVDQTMHIFVLGVTAALVFS